MAHNMHFFYHKEMLLVHLNPMELETMMDLKIFLKISILFLAGSFSLSANSALIVLDETDIFGVFAGNDADAADFSSDTGIAGVAELFRDESFDDTGGAPGVFSGTVTKVEFLDYLVVKFDGLYGVYDVMAYAIGDVLEWHTSDFSNSCNDLDAMYEIGLNCGAATSHVTGYGVVPVPPAVWLFGSGLLGLAGIARRKA